MTAVAQETPSEHQKWVKDGHSVLVDAGERQEKNKILMKPGDALKVKCDTVYFFSILLKYSKYRQLHKSLIDGLINFFTRWCEGSWHSSFLFSSSKNTDFLKSYLWNIRQS